MRCLPAAAFLVLPAMPSEARPLRSGRVCGAKHLSENAESANLFPLQVPWPSHALIPTFQPSNLLTFQRSFALPTFPSPANSTPLFSFSYAFPVRMTLLRQILLVLKMVLTG